MSLSLILNLFIVVVVFCFAFCFCVCVCFGLNSQESVGDARSEESASCSKHKCKINASFMITEQILVSNHQRFDCLLSRLCRRTSMKTPNPASLAFVRGIHW